MRIGEAEIQGENAAEADVPLASALRRFKESRQYINHKVISPSKNALTRAFTRSYEARRDSLYQEGKIS